MKFDSIMYFRLFLAACVLGLSALIWFGQKGTFEQRIDAAPDAEALGIAEGMLEVHLMTWPFIVIPVILFWVFTAGVGVVFRAYRRKTYGIETE